MSNGLLISAPKSGSGKTIITLGLLRALKIRGIPILSAKSGPDYIDPGFHNFSSGSKCYNLDSWAMSKERVNNIASKAKKKLLLIEGAMGLFDGATSNSDGSTAHLAKLLNLPIVLIIDASKTGQSVAALANGFLNYDKDVLINGIILNKVSSLSHEKLLRNSLSQFDCPVIGSVYKNKELELPSRHLGLIQALENKNLDQFINNAAEIIENSIDLDNLLKLGNSISYSKVKNRLQPPAQRISVALDAAFSFVYPHLLDDWHSNGAEIKTFSPLSDQGPEDCDLVILPGGYPELYAEKLSNAQNFFKKIKNAPNVYGECGGYMVMGKGFIDEEGNRHKMLGLLNLETSFHNKQLHLGYRDIFGKAGPFSGPYAAHEFHYASTIKENGRKLFSVSNSKGEKLTDTGLFNEKASGSFLHVIDKR